MGEDLFTRIDLAKLYPPFADRVQQLVASLEQVHGVQFFAVQGLRTMAQQDALYAKGRTLPGPKVTNARGGYSAHNYGAAVDLVRDADIHLKGLQPVWKADGYKLLADEAVKLGLEPGYLWTTISDADHVQLPLAKHGLTWPILLAKSHKEGLPGVFALLDTYTW